MDADFSGWATKSGLKCSDGRTIAPNAFQHQDKMQVPLVWQHGHKDPENVLGHVILEHRKDGDSEGVYAHAFFNKSAKAQHAKQAVEHRDIRMLSIWANELVEKSKNVLHGKIREVSLVLSGANPGAIIENIAIHHSDDYDEILDDEAIIYTGLELEHSDDENSDNGSGDEEVEVVEPGEEDNSDDAGKDEEKSDSEKDADGTDDKTDNEDAGKEDENSDVTHAAGDDDETMLDVYNTLDAKQKKLVDYMIDQAIDSAEHSDIDNKDDDNDAESGKKGTSTMGHTNVFEKKEEDGAEAHVLSHDDLMGIVAKADRLGSLKAAVDDYALAHNITDIDNLFPDARLITDVPEFRKRRTEWVNVVLEGVRKSPFSRIKTLSADLTFEDARAKGYIKGTLKKEEFFPVAKRVTLPTTVYKKQKLDRDDMIDITDFDVVMWLKGEMRIMLDEEIARVILIGDGRDISHEDKINEQNIRPIATDNELYTTTVNVNIDDASSSVMEVVDAIIMNRKHLRGSGLPIMFTTETYISRFMLLKDSTGRRIYKNLDELASELRVSSIVAVEVMEEDDEVVCIIVNPIDYVVGADKGGQVSMFDDFDIDYNKYRYLIETRMSGALVKLKAAIVVKKVASGVTLLTPTAPTFNSNTGVITIPTQTGVVYKDADDNTLSAGAQAAIDASETFVVYAYPSSGSYAFNNDEDDQWAFTREAS